MKGEILIYQNTDGNIKIDVRLEEETVWLNQDQMATLFGKGRSTITEHIGNVYEEGELEQNSTSRKFRLVQKEGSREVARDVDCYILEAILAVGYRVNSCEAIQFRIWATNTLKKFITKGFVLDDERLKQGKKFGKDYFDELLGQSQMSSFLHPKLDKLMESSIFAI